METGRDDPIVLCTIGGGGLSNLPDLGTAAVKASRLLETKRAATDPHAGQLRSQVRPAPPPPRSAGAPRPFLLSLPEPAARKAFGRTGCNITFTQPSKRFHSCSLNRLVNCRSFQNNRMYYLIRVPEKVFFAFIFFHLVLIVSFFVYVLNYYASTNPAAFGMLKN